MRWDEVVDGARGISDVAEVWRRPGTRQPVVWEKTWTGERVLISGASQGWKIAAHDVGATYVPDFLRASLLFKVQERQVFCSDAYEHHDCLTAGHWNRDSDVTRAHALARVDILHSAAPGNQGRKIDRRGEDVPATILVDIAQLKQTQTTAVRTAQLDAGSGKETEVAERREHLKILKVHDVNLASVGDEHDGPIRRILRMCMLGAARLLRPRHVLADIAFSERRVSRIGVTHVINICGTVSVIRCTFSRARYWRVGERHDG